MQFTHYFHLFLFVVAFGIICTGCASRPKSVIVDTGDIERLRSEYQQLRGEFDKLQSDYQRLAENSQYYADYYQHTTERIAAGTDELAAISASNATEIAKLRSYVTILRNIINSIIEGETRERSRDTAIDAN